MPSTINDEEELQLLKKKSRDYFGETLQSAKKSFRDPEAARRERKRIRRHLLSLIYRSIELVRGGGKQ